MLDGRTNGAAAVAAASQVAREATLGGLAIVGGQLRGALHGEVARPCEFVAGVDQFEGVFDCGRRQQSPGQLAGDGGAPQPLAFLEHTDQILGERDVVDEPHPLESLDLVLDHVVGKLTRPQGALELAAGLPPARQGVHRHVLGAGEIGLTTLVGRLGYLGCLGNRIAPWHAGVVGLGFTPEEVVRLTMEFYKRNYIEGLFLSSGIIQSPDYTMEQLVRVARLLREVEFYGGYIHLKAVPGASRELMEQAGRYADRLSANIELPTQARQRG